MSGGTRVLVTGGAGFIGSELVAQLLEDGRSVVVLDSLVNGCRENLAGLRAELVEGDVRDISLLRRLVRDADTVFHLACLGVRHSLHSPRDNHDVNATATLGVLEATSEAGVRRFVHVSTSEVYGTARAVPMSEDHPTCPSTIYGASKLAGETYARILHASRGLPAVIVRPFNTYGPRSHHEGDSGEVIPRFMLRALAGRPLVVFGDGRQTRDLTDVSDIARGIRLAASCDAAIGRTINLGSGREIAIERLARAVGDAVGREVEVRHEPERPGDVRRLCADAGLARTLLGWEPLVSLRDGLVRLVDWYRASGATPEERLEAEVLHNWLPPAEVNGSSRAGTGREVGRP